MRRARDRSTQGRLALRFIEYNLTFTPNDVWAWFVLPTQPWAFRSDNQREQLLHGFADALSGLAGYRLHLRVTSRPYPADDWARRLHGLTPQPLASQHSRRESWSDYLVMAQRHLRNQTMAEKEVYLGVRVRSRAGIDRLLSRLTRRPATGEYARLVSEVERVTETVGLPGLDGRPATPREIEWLVRRSVGLCLPSPKDLAPLDSSSWDDDDIYSFADRVEYAAEPLARTVRLTTRGSNATWPSFPSAAWNPSPAYLLGLNPGGDPIVQKTETVAWDLTTSMPSRPANWSAYRDEAWGGVPGTSGLQPRVLHLLNRLSLDPGTTASSNLVFVRSAREASVAKAEMAAYAGMCWGFHEAVIHELGVKAVVCFGSTVGAQVRKRLDARKEWGQFVERNARGWTSRAHVGRGGLNVVTVTHPSIADWSNPAADVSDLVAEAIR